MTFSRTASGLLNYRFFFGADAILYVEGDDPKAPIQGMSPDEIFYAAVTRRYAGKHVKIKVVGDKRSALEYHARLNASGAKHWAVVVDKDLEGVLAEEMEVPRLHYTSGYSWENDFWTPKLCVEVFLSMALGNASGVEEVRSSLRRGAKRLHSIFAIDCGLQFNGKKLVAKNGNTCGMKFDFRLGKGMELTEYRWLAGRYAVSEFYGCPTTRSVINLALKAPYDRVIQGHAWEGYCLLLLGHFYKKYTGAKVISGDVLKNLALAHFHKDPDDFLSNESKRNYMKVIASLAA